MRKILIFVSLIFIVGCFPGMIDYIEWSAIEELCETKAGQTLNEKLSEYWTGKMVWPKKATLKGAWSNTTFSGFCLVTAINTEHGPGGVLLRPGHELYTCQIGNSIFKFYDQSSKEKFERDPIFYHEKALFHLFPADKLHLIEEPDAISHNETNLFRFADGHLIAFSSEEAKKKALTKELWPKLFAAWMAIWEEKAWGKPLDTKVKKELANYFEQK